MLFFKKVFICTDLFSNTLNKKCIRFVPKEVGGGGGGVPFPMPLYSEEGMRKLFYWP